MKKILVSLFILLGIVGCSCSNNKAKDAVENYLNDYKGLSSNVLTSIDELVKKESMEDKHKDTYKEVIKRQYRDLMYTIENEEYNGDNAKVTVKITVYDLYKAQKNASDYLNEHQSEFTNNGVHDANKYLEYKLEQMKSIKDTISYNIVFKVNKTDGKWVVEQPDEETLEKIHGIYNYNND